MNDIKTKHLTKNISQDSWFNGKSEKTASGADTYYICQYLDRTHYDGLLKEFYIYCKYKKIKIDNPAESCNMSCDQYGRCDTCSGFSAIRCQECEIPRP